MADLFDKAPEVRKDVDPRSPRGSFMKIPKPTSTTMLEICRLWLKEHLDKGTRCPCCDQHAKIYRRKLNSAMVTTLRVCVRETEKIFHAPTILKAAKVGRDRDMSYLKEWGLVQEEEGKGRGGRTAGMYSVTELGRAFSEGRSKVPKYLFFFNQKVVARSEVEIGIDEAKVDRFHVSEVMAPANAPERRFE